jgi:hypothetical protein
LGRVVVGNRHGCLGDQRRGGLGVFSALMDGGPGFGVWEPSESKGTEWSFVWLEEGGVEQRWQ